MTQKPGTPKVVFALCQTVPIFKAAAKVPLFFDDVSLQALPLTCCLAGVVPCSKSASILDPLLSAVFLHFQATRGVPCVRTDERIHVCCTNIAKRNGQAIDTDATDSWKCICFDASKDLPEIKKTANTLDRGPITVHAQSYTFICGYIFVQVYKVYMCV